MTDKITSDYYAFVKQHPCIKCNSLGSEASHIYGFISPKTGLEMPRSHKTMAKYACIPLCPECHRTGKESIHAIGEDKFFEGLGKTPCYVFKYLATQICEFFLEREGKL